MRREKGLLVRCSGEPAADWLPSDDNGSPLPRSGWPDWDNGWPTMAVWRPPDSPEGGDNAFGRCVASGAAHNGTCASFPSTHAPPTQPTNGNAAICARHSRLIDLVLSFLSCWLHLYRTSVWAVIRFVSSLLPACTRTVIRWAALAFVA